MKRLSKILLIADAGAESSTALKRALALARNNQASLTLVDVVESTPVGMGEAIPAVTPEELTEIAVAEKRERLRRIVENCRSNGVEARPKVLVGKAFIEIVRQVLRDGHDLVIKRADSSVSLKNLFFGSTDMRLMRKCPCAVWITGEDESCRYRRILAAVDFDPEDVAKDGLNRQILEMAASLAVAEASELHVVHAWRFGGEDVYRSARVNIAAAEVDAMVAVEANERRDWLQGLVDSYGAKSDREAVDYLRPKLHVVKGDPREIVPETARDLDVDLIVMGTVARSGIPGFFMGNTAESILSQIRCSILTMKPPGFESPIS